MKRFTRRCWSRPLYLMAAGCSITSTLTSTTSASMWADEKHASHTLYTARTKSKRMWDVWKRSLFTFFYYFAFFFSVCRSRPSVRKWPQRESPTPPAAVLASLPANLPPRKPKSKTYFIPTRKHIPLSGFSLRLKHFVRSGSLNTHKQKGQNSETNCSPAVGWARGSWASKMVWMWFMNVEELEWWTIPDAERVNCIHDVDVKQHLSTKYFRCGQKCTICCWFQMNTLSVSLLSYSIYCIIKYCC